MTDVDPTTMEPTTATPDKTDPLKAFHMITILIVSIFVIFFVVKPLHIRIPRFDRFSFWLDFGVAPFLGVVILLCTTTIGFDTVLLGIEGNGKIIPWNILVIFYSLAYLCVSWDLTGVFSYVAKRVLMAANNRGRRIFIYFFILSSLLTVFTSNDIVILVLTPIICYIANYTKVDPTPFLISQFFAANIWSIFLVIGNPTNIIVAEAYKLKFLEYTAWMGIPTMVAGFTALTTMWIVFRNKVPVELDTPKFDHPTVYDLKGCIIATVTMGGCLCTLIITQWISIPLWVVTLCAGSIMFTYDLIFDISSYVRRGGKQSIRHGPGEERSLLPAKSVEDSISANPEPSSEVGEEIDYYNMNFGKLRLLFDRMPWRILPFVVCMFIIVEGLVHTGWVGVFAKALASIINSSTGAGIAVIGFLSIVTCSLINNQPMTILFTQILQHHNFTASDESKMASMFALIVGSNFGANITLVGALAGLMWHKILQDNKIDSINYRIFMKYGLTIMPFVICGTFLTLYIEFLIKYS